MRIITASFLIAAGPVFADDIVGALVSSILNLGKSAIEVYGAYEHRDPQTNPPFDAKDQHVDVTGVHAWKPAGPDDERGPCPGLNALANHGYLPRNGIADIVTLTSATSQVYNMGLDLSAVLAAYGGALDGPAGAWSIGGKQHTGISGSRGNYESDSSPMMGDLDQYGSNSKLVMSQFHDLFNMQPDPATANYDINVIADFRGRRFNQSVAGNPNFYYSPFAGVGVTQAAFSFIYRLMANHSEEYPVGRLDQETLKSFFGVEGDGEGMVWRRGYERIPDNWYKRASNDAYGIPQLGFDSSFINTKYPDTGKPGCNQGKVNSYVFVNQSVTDSNAYDFSKPNAALCYGLAYATQHQPLVGAVADAVAQIILPFQDALGCTTVPSLNKTISDTCSGYTLYGGPDGAVATGSIQN